MNAAVLKSAPVIAALVSLAVGGCASTRLSQRAATMPVFAMEQAHPAVAEAMGPVKTYFCPGSNTEASIAQEAMNTLRSHAEGMGAAALVDYRYRVLPTLARASQCQRFVEAEAVAVVFGNGAVAHAASAHLAPG